MEWIKQSLCGGIDAGKKTDVILRVRFNDRGRTGLVSKVFLARVSWQRRLIMD